MTTTSNIIAALRLLAADSVHCDDVAGAAIAEAADRLEALSSVRWQTLEEALPVYAAEVCVQRDGIRFPARCRMRNGVKIWWVGAPLGAGSAYRARGTDRWHPWPGEGKK